MAKKFLLAIILLLFPVLYSYAGEDAGDNGVKFVFTHKFNRIFDRELDLRQLGGLYKMMPRRLKREIASQYYPSLRDSLQASDSTVFMDACASKQVFSDGTMQINLSFPKFYLTMEHITWTDLDGIFLKYFK